MSGDVEGLERRSLEDPDFVDLGLGTPGYSLFPLGRLGAACAAACGRPAPATWLQYGASTGSARFRESLAAFLAAQQPALPRRVEPDEIFVTNGASQALDLIAKHFSAPGDTVLVEQYTYFLAFGVFRDRGLRVVPVSCDSRGLLLEDLAAKLSATNAKLLYTIPAFQNPTGATLAEDRRARVVELARKHGCLVVADEVYQLLHFDDSSAPPPPPLWTYGPEVVSLNSFSKLLAPGMRLGWLQTTSRTVLEKLDSDGVVTSGGGLNPFASSIVGEMIDSGSLAEHISFVRNRLRFNADAMCAALVRCFGDSLEFERPGGGFFLWARTHSGFDAAQKSKMAHSQRVAFRSGGDCSASSSRFLFLDPSSRPVQEPEHFLRLCFAHYDIPEITKGVERLSTVLLAH